VVMTIGAKLAFEEVLETEELLRATELGFNRDWTVDIDDVVVMTSEVEFE